MTRSVQNSYFSNVIHMKDVVGVFCNAKVGGDLRNQDPHLVTCKKCLHFLEHPWLLANKRKRAQEEVQPLFND